MLNNMFFFIKDFFSHFSDVLRIFKRHDIDRKSHELSKNHRFIIVKRTLDRENTNLKPVYFSRIMVCFILRKFFRFASSFYHFLIVLHGSFYLCSQVHLAQKDIP